MDVVSFLKTVPLGVLICDQREILFFNDALCDIFEIDFAKEKDKNAFKGDQDQYIDLIHQKPPVALFCESGKQFPEILHYWFQ